MRENLKNRPVNTKNHWKMHAWKDYEKWFEGFEKELREKLGLLPLKRFNINAELIKEILGETKT